MTRFAIKYLISRTDTKFREKKKNVLKIVCAIDQTASKKIVFPGKRDRSYT